ncbi:MAG: hypothetical protein JRL30_01715 [Deltaproteobacteria bacterium]|nr:hypothetical protein [Deltaproteobacteria bacterium]
MTSGDALNIPPVRQFEFKVVCIAAIWVFTVLFATGCGFFAAVPVTVSEIKTYLVGKEESLSYPLNQVLESAVYNLERMGFDIERVERFNQKGLIHAVWEGTSVSLTLETITPKLTKVICTFKRPDTMREYSSEKELFNNVRDSLKLKQVPNGDILFKGMVTVHASMDTAAPVIAYLGRGAKAEIVSRSGEWAEIVLMDNCTGYMAFRYLGRGVPVGKHP